MRMPKQWLHVGHSELREGQFQPVTNQLMSSKPLGGLWASPFHINQPYKSDWHEFETNVWGKKKNQKAVIFSFKKSTRFYVIDTLQDLIQLTQEVGKTPNPLPFLRKSYVDYENASRLYDVIYLTRNGQAETRHPFPNSEFDLYGWDCECCLVLNFHVIEKQMPIILK